MFKNAIYRPVTGGITHKFFNMFMKCWYRQPRQRSSRGERLSAAGDALVVSYGRFPVIMRYYHEEQIQRPLADNFEG